MELYEPPAGSGFHIRSSDLVFFLRHHRLLNCTSSPSASVRALIAVRYHAIRSPKSVPDTVSRSREFQVHIHPRARTRRDCPKTSEIVRLNSLRVPTLPCASGSHVARGKPVFIVLSPLRFGPE